MSYQPTLIAPFNSGLSLYYKPFLIGKDAFTNLTNCYSQRGKIRKREGSSILGRLPKWATTSSITNTTPPIVTLAAHGLITGDMVHLNNVQNSLIAGITTGVVTTITTNIPHGLAPGQIVRCFGGTGTAFTGNGGNFPGLNNLLIPVITVPAANQFTLNADTEGLTAVAGGAVFTALNNVAFRITRLGPNTFSLQNLFTQQDVVASGSAITADIYLPVVGLRTFLQQSSLSEFLIAFHPKKAFEFDTTTQAFVDISFDTTSTAISWTGIKDNFFYSCNYASVMWATNNVDPIRYFNGNLGNGWADHTPTLDGAGNILNKALIILPYKGRLVVLNTTETGQSYPQRARWSQIGTPFYHLAPPGYNPQGESWLSDLPGRGGFIDADTSETIISAEIIQDTMIVGFQFSTWRLRYTGNEVLPFIWERIDIQYGSASTFAVIAFDDGLVQISRRGIVKSTFNNVDRIDLDIPDFVNEIENGEDNNGFIRVNGIRDFNKRLVYWSYCTSGNATPNQMLCFNYQDNTWAYFDKGFTCLGKFKTSLDNTWDTWTSIWDGDSTTWQDPYSLLGTQLMVGGATDSRVWSIMDPSLSQDNGVNYNFSVTTGLVNPYFNGAVRCRLAYYDLYMTSTDTGAITVQNYTDDNDTQPWLTRAVSTINVPNISKYFRVFLGMIARQHQIVITMSDDQLNDINIGSSMFELQGIIFHTRPEGRIKQ